MHSKAWTGNSAIFIVTDENDFTGNTATDGWETAGRVLRLARTPGRRPRMSATVAGRHATAAA